MKWMPIETAPKDGTEIILGSPPAVFEGKEVPARSTVGHWMTDAESRVYVGDCGCECRCPEYEYAKPMWMSWDGGFLPELPPTHWMPLPEPPHRSPHTNPPTGEE